MADVLAITAGGIKALDAGIALGKNNGLFSKAKMLIKGTKEIVLLGCSGTGKTQFIKSLSDGRLEYVRERDKTLLVYSKRQYFREHSIRIFDTPGQIAYDEQRKDLLKTIITKRKSIGIINVVCYGYHIGDRLSNNSFIEPGSLEKYVEANRRNEIEQLSIVNQFCSLSDVKWVITLVTKADLWNKVGKDKILDYYKDGTYSKAMNTKIFHVIVPYCSVIQNYYGSVFSSISEVEKIDINNDFVGSFTQLLNFKRKS